MSYYHERIDEATIRNYSFVEEPTLDERFEQYDRENPHVYSAFLQFTLQVIGTSNKCAARTVMERIRWETLINGNDKWKINNNYTSRYARKFMKQFPAHEGFFATRGLRS